MAVITNECARTKCRVPFNWRALIPPSCAVLCQAAAEDMTRFGRRQLRWRGQRSTDGLQQLAAARSTAEHASPAACLRWARATPPRAAATQLSWRSPCTHRCTFHANVKGCWLSNAAVQWRVTDTTPCAWRGACSTCHTTRKPCTLSVRELVTSGSIYARG